MTGATAPTQFLARGRLRTQSRTKKNNKQLSHTYTDTNTHRHTPLYSPQMLVSKSPCPVRCPTGGSEAHGREIRQQRRRRRRRPLRVLHVRRVGHTRGSCGQVRAFSATLGDGAPSARRLGSFCLASCAFIRLLKYFPPCKYFPDWRSPAS